MRTFEIDFSLEGTPWFRAVSRRWLQASRLGWTLLVCGALAATYALARHHAALAARRAYQTQVERIAQQEAARHRLELAHQPAPSRPYLEDKKWQRAAAELSRPWTSSLAAIEETATSPIYLTALRVDPVSGHIQIDAEAPHYEDILAYVLSLQKEVSLTEPQLISHESTQEPDGRASVKFSVQMQWAAPVSAPASDSGQPRP